MKGRYFYDSMYGKIYFDSPITQITLSSPALLRLSEIRMSNINFSLFPGFGGSTRFEHSIGVGYLAQTVANNLNLPQKDRYELVLSAVFHDVLTPPFGHTFESVMRKFFNFDHEVEGTHFIFGKSSIFRSSKYSPIFCNKFSNLANFLDKLNRKMNNNIEIENIYKYMKGEGKFGKMIKSDIDLDNIDNVFRAAYHIGIYLDSSLPIKISKSFSYDYREGISYDYSKRNLIAQWLETRNKLYTEILLNTYDFNRETMLRYAIEKGFEVRLLNEHSWRLTDPELMALLGNYDDSGTKSEIKETIRRLRLGEIRKDCSNSCAFSR